MDKTIKVGDVIKIILEASQEETKDFNRFVDNADNSTVRFTQKQVYQGGVLAIELFTKALIDKFNGGI